MSEYDLDPGYPVIYCEHCDMTFTVRPISKFASKVPETTPCQHRRNGKACGRPFWHSKDGHGIDPERWAEWQS